MLPVAEMLAQLLAILRLPRQMRRRGIVRLSRRLLLDSRGGEVLEYALVAGLIVAGAIGAITCVGMKVLSRWQSVNSKA